MKPVLLAIAAVLVALSFPTAAQADEIFGGVYVHDVDTPFTLSGVEGGADVQLGWRGDRIGRSPLQPYAFVALNTAGETHYAAAGLSMKFGDRFFIRPGLGIAVHTGSAANFENRDNGKIDFGSRVLFEPELGVGARINDRTTVEASWVHMSTAQFFGKQNPGIDNFGLRLSFKL